MNLEIVDGVLRFGSFMAVTIGILVLFIGRRLTNKINFLKEFSIPEPVSGGLLISIVITLIFMLTNVAIEFDLTARNVLLVYFFTTIGINSSLKDLLQGGKPLVFLLLITIAYMIIQNITGISIAGMFGLNPAVGMLGGSVSLIGGHGTAIAWAPQIAERFDINNAMEIGIASATFGLILASLMGGPIAKFLINKHNLTCSIQDSVTTSDEVKIEKTINKYDFLDAILAIHICVVVGFLLNMVVTQFGLQLPLFVTCLFAGILITNIVPDSFPRLSGQKWPTRTPAVALIADISLGTFLAMSLMSMQLWTLVDLAGPIFTILAAQFVVAILINIYVVFPVMGKNYDEAVICAGFGGISLGSTPTAMANMSAVSHRYGPSALAFIIVPLVCAFFIDLVNALMIPLFLNQF
ncbi:sodium/glutamate symporter [Colwelliaceae bacterium BS250]